MMINVPIENNDNALNMLFNKAKFLGWIGDIRYYILDGKAWCIKNGIVSRSDDDEETQQIRRQVEGLNKL